MNVVADSEGSSSVHRSPSLHHAVNRARSCPFTAICSPHPAAGCRQLAPAEACEPWLRRLSPQEKTDRMAGLSLKTAVRAFRENCSQLGDGESLVAAKSAAVRWGCAAFERGGRFRRLLERSPIPFASTRGEWDSWPVTFCGHRFRALSSCSPHPAAGCRQSAPEEACEPWLRMFSPQGKTDRTSVLSVKTAAGLGTVKVSSLRNRPRCVGGCGP